jgi:hypothetical protein
MNIQTRIELISFILFFPSFVFQKPAYSEIKSRSPIRTWANSSLCLCPYDQVVTKGIDLAFPDSIYQCGSSSAWYRSGGKEPACFSGERNSYKAMEVESYCRRRGLRNCYVDFMNRF